MHAPGTPSKPGSPGIPSRPSKPNKYWHDVVKSLQKKLHIVIDFFFNFYHRLPLKHILSTLMFNSKLIIIFRFMSINYNIIENSNRSKIYKCKALKTNDISTCKWWW